MGESQEKNMDHGAEVLLRWFFTVGQTVFLRSSQGGLESRLRSSAVPRTAADYVATVDDREPVTAQSAEDWREYLRDQMAEGVGRSALPFDPLITARPTAEIQPSPDPEIDDRDWSRIAEASSMIARVKRLDGRAEAVLEAMYGDHGLEWPAAGFRHGALYRFDEHAIELLGRLRRHEGARLEKLRSKGLRPEERTDLQLMVAEAERARKPVPGTHPPEPQDTDALRELERVEANARRLLGRISALWHALEAADPGTDRDVRALVSAALTAGPQPSEVG